MCVCQNISTGAQMWCVSTHKNHPGWPAFLDKCHHLRFCLLPLQVRCEEVLYYDEWLLMLLFSQHRCKRNPAQQFIAECQLLNVKLPLNFHETLHLGHLSAKGDSTRKGVQGALVKCCKSYEVLKSWRIGPNCHANCHLPRLHCEASIHDVVSFPSLVCVWDLSHSAYSA
jgi:hypothetical protein